MSGSKKDKFHSFGYWALRIHLAHRTAMDKELKEIGIKAGQAYFMVAVGEDRNRPKTMTELQQNFGVSHPAIVNHVNELMKMGLARKEVSPEDKRARLISLSDEGLKALPKIREVLRHLYLISNEGIDEADLLKAVEVARKVRSNILREYSFNE